MRTRFHAKVLLGWLLLAAVLPQAAWGARKSKPLPEFSNVASVAKRHFETIPDYKPGDFISQSDAKPLFDQLHMMGWRVPDRKKILLLLPDDSHYVTQQLRSKKGVKFMRKIASYPDAYDRLYQLGKLQGGRRLVHDLIQGKGGHEMIGYLTSSKGGKNLTKMLADTPHGKNFGEPTGRIYTAEAFIERLKESHEATIQALAARKK